MKLNRLLPVLFFVALGLEIYGSESGIAWMVWIFKPMLIPLLWAYFRIEIDTTTQTFRGLQAALFFSWMGDIALMFGTQYFLLGLGCFFLTQLSYTVIFTRQIPAAARSLKNKILVAIPFLLYLLFFLNWILPQLGLRPDGATLRIPLILYGIMITSMGITAFLRPRNPNTSYTWIGIGALFFIASDSLLAYNQFIAPLPASGLSIMVTYGVAQFGIIHGSKFYLKV